MVASGISDAEAGPAVEGVVIKKQKARRVAYDAQFKLKVVREALLRPAGSRIKPTCRDYPDIEPEKIPRSRHASVRARAHFVELTLRSDLRSALPC